MNEATVNISKKTISDKDDDESSIGNEESVDNSDAGSDNNDEGETVVHQNKFTLLPTVE